MATRRTRRSWRRVEHPLEGEETNWKGKVFLSTREQKSTTIDYDPPNRVSWKSEGDKGTIDGTVTFTPIGENATLMLVVLEYRSARVRSSGSRTGGGRSVGGCRLDLKHFRRYVMRTEPDDLPEPEEADEIPEDAQEEPEDDQYDDEGEDSEDEYEDEEESEDEYDEEDEPEEEEDGYVEPPKRRTRGR